MDVHVIESWLQNASLPGSPEARFNADGMWTVSVNQLKLTLAPDPVDEIFYLYAPLIGLGDNPPADFYAELLTIQSEARLPAGMMFGLEEDTVVLTGRFEARLFDAALLEKLLRDTMAALCRLPSELADVMSLLSSAYSESDGDFLSDDGLETAGDYAKSPFVADETDRAEAETEDALRDTQSENDSDELSDEELLRLQMMQNVRI